MIRHSLFKNKALFVLLLNTNMEESDDDAQCTAPVLAQTRAENFYLTVLKSKLKAAH